MMFTKENKAMHPCVKCGENKAPNPNWLCAECTQKQKAKVQEARESLPLAKRKVSNVFREALRQEQERNNS